MVNNELRSQGIVNAKVIKAMLKVQRHEFVPEGLKDYAYINRPLPIGYEQTISQPYIVAYMTQLLELSDYDKVLEIGTGSGYQAAILAEICDTVYTVEIVEPLAKRAEKTLNSLGYKNIKYKTGDGYRGWTEFAPFDAVIVTCAPSHIPEPLKEQLAEGGTMIIPVGEEGEVQFLYLLKKIKGKVKQQEVLPVRFVPMTRDKNENY